MDTTQSIYFITWRTGSKELDNRFHILLATYDHFLYREVLATYERITEGWNGRKHSIVSLIVDVNSVMKVMGMPKRFTRYCSGFIVRDLGDRLEVVNDPQPMITMCSRVDDTEEFIETFKESVINRWFARHDILGKSTSIYDVPHEEKMSLIEPLGMAPLVNVFWIDHPKYDVLLEYGESLKKRKLEECVPRPQKRAKNLSI